MFQEKALTTHTQHSSVALMTNTFEDFRRIYGSCDYEPYTAPRYSRSQAFRYWLVRTPLARWERHSDLALPLETLLVFALTVALIVTLACTVALPSSLLGILGAVGLGALVAVPVTVAMVKLGSWFQG